MVVHATAPIAVLALVEAGPFALFGALVICLLIFVGLALTHGSESAYDRIGAGGMTRESDYADASATPTPESPAARAEREREIRQLLSARSERLVRSGQPALDIDAELGRLLAVEHAPSGPDAGLLAEVRQLVAARNERRVRQGMEPLDVDAEVARTLEELGP